MLTSHWLIDDDSASYRVYTGGRVAECAEINKLVSSKTTAVDLMFLVSINVNVLVEQEIFRLHTVLV